MPDLDSETTATRTPSHRGGLQSLAMTAVKIVIAVVGIGLVISKVTWYDKATLIAHTSIRAVMVNEDTPVRVVGRDMAPGNGNQLYRIEFPRTPVNVRVDTRDGPRDFELVIDEDTPIPGTNEKLDVPRELELDRSHFKVVDDQIVHEGLRTIALRASAKWPLMICAWLVLATPFLVTAIRWRGLMIPQGIRMPLGKCLQLTFVGQFYSILLPGITGGDLVKIIYTSRLTGSKTKSFITVILDRAIGLVALIVIAGAAAAIQLLVNFRKGMPVDGTLLNVFILIVGLLLALGAGATIYFSRRLRSMVGIEWFIEHFGQLSANDDPQSPQHRQLERMFRNSNAGAFICSMIGIGVLAILRWGIGSNWAQHNGLIVFGGIAALSIMALVAVAGLLLHDALVHRATPLMGKAIGAILRVDETLHVYRGHFPVLLWAFMISIVSQLTVPVSAWLCGQAFGMHAPITSYFAYVPTAILAASIPISFQGLGLLDFIIKHFFVDRGTDTASLAFALAQAVRFLPILWNLVGAYWVITGQYSRRDERGPEARG